MLEAWIHAGMSQPFEMATTTVTVPEPGAILLLVAGTGFLAALQRRRSSRLSRSD
jgi:hypothetical protein